jgi:hypothetical protein
VKNINFPGRQEERGGGEVETMKYRWYCAPRKFAAIDCSLLSRCMVVETRKETRMQLPILEEYLENRALQTGFDNFLSIAVRKRQKD